MYENNLIIKIQNTDNKGIFGSVLQYVVIFCEANRWRQQTRPCRLFLRRIVAYSCYVHTRPPCYHSQAMPEQADNDVNCSALSRYYRNIFYEQLVISAVN